LLPDKKWGIRECFSPCHGKEWLNYWVAQSVGRLTLGAGRDIGVVVLSPHVRLCAQAGLGLSLLLLLSPLPQHSLSL